MAQILVRKLGENVKDALKRRAASRGRSLEEEVRRILEREAAAPVEPDEGRGARIARLFDGVGLREGEWLERPHWRWRSPPDFGE